MRSLSPLSRVAATMLLLCFAVLAGCDTQQPNSTAPVAPVARVTSIDRDGPAVLSPDGRPLSMAKLPPLSIQSYPSLAGCAIGYDFTHNTGRQAMGAPSAGNQYSTLFGDYAARGATISEITTFNYATLSSYCLVWIEEDWTSQFTPTQVTDLVNYVQNGGSVVIVGDEWSNTNFMQAFGFDYTSGTEYGSTTNITTHPLTAGVTTMAFSGAVSAITVAPPGITLVYNQTGTERYIGFRQYGLGRVVMLGDEFLMNGVISNADNRVFGNNLIPWLCQTEVMIDIKPNDAVNAVNCQNPNALITVAILSSTTFNATMVPTASVRFMGAAEFHVNNKTGIPQQHVEDVNADGLMDAVFHFRLGATTLNCSSDMGHLTGTFSLQHIHGSDHITMVHTP